MKFHVVTPSYNQLDFLRRCVASVVDQVNAGWGREALGVGRSDDEPIANGSFSVHHHVQDGGSTDGTCEFLAEHEAKSQQLVAKGYTFSYESEPDSGMYDAINLGWLRAEERGRKTEDGERKSEGRYQKAEGDQMILGHLNADEQYLLGALKTIADYFSKHRNVDVALADMVVVDGNGDYICHRRSLKPKAFLSRLCCVGMTTTTFQRASVVRDRKVLFDTSWRNIGDKVWYSALHKNGIRFGVLNELTSLFVDTGDNLNLTDEAVQERQRYAREYLFGLKWPTRAVSKFYSFRRYLKEFRMSSPKEYELYWNNLEKREIRSIEKPTPLWHRMGPKW